MLLVVGNSVVVVVVVVVLAAVVVVGWGVVVVVVVVEVVELLLVGIDSGKRFDADTLNDLKSDWKFNSDGCVDVDGGDTDDVLCVDENDAVDGW